MSNKELNVLNLKQRQLLSVVLRTLRKFPAGISEYNLIKELVKLGFLEGPKHNQYENHELFKIHFLLFHHLYLLHNRLLFKQSALLQICPTSIKLLEYQSHDDGLSVVDPLKSYYLDISQLSSTCAGDVDRMLDKFWSIFLSPDSLTASLSVLGLTSPASGKKIKLRYRKLAMEHHPDRGGDPEKLKAIHQAMKVLKPHYNC